MAGAKELSDRTASGCESPSPWTETPLGCDGRLFSKSAQEEQRRKQRASRFAK